jgi:hypothetical protein
MKKFKKTTEDFVCNHCGEEVVGNGFTNHCPNCLWSKHVDINPGDRREGCGGMMKPVSCDKNGENIFITHKCLDCRYKKKNKVTKEDNFEKIISL